jgi:ribosome biogenesis GTPase A
MVFSLHLKEGSALQQNIGWYPGHMAKARRLLMDQIKRVDAVIEICDARLPQSSRNPELGLLVAGKPVLLLMSKADLADPDITARWLAYFTQAGLSVLAMETGKKMQRLVKSLEALTLEKLSRAEKRGLPRAARVMVLGVPNVGKSTLINFLAGRSALKVQDKPGITRAPQWINASPRLQLLDTPGLLWPKLGDPVAARRLAYIAAVRDDVLDIFQLALSLLNDLMLTAPNGISARYGVSDTGLRGQELLEAVCLSRGFLLRGGMPDLDRGAVCVLDEFRAGLLGRISLEAPAGESHEQG